VEGENPGGHRIVSSSFDPGDGRKFPGSRFRFDFGFPGMVQFFRSPSLFPFLVAKK
jgi:hypothetical protein